MRFNVPRAIEFFIRNPDGQCPIGKYTYLKCVTRFITFGTEKGWMTHVYAHSIHEKRWFAATASSWEFREGRVACLRSALYRLCDPA